MKNDDNHNNLLQNKNWIFYDIFRQCDIDILNQYVKLIY